MSYYIFSTTLNKSFTDGLDLIKIELRKEGFGILTEIDIQATFKKKLDIDFPKYWILGACNPSFAYQALQVEETLGTMLPCNVIIQENTDGQVEVSAVDPVSYLQAIVNPELGNIARQVQTKLKTIIENLSLTENNNH